jgi:hypothetical protein
MQQLLDIMRRPNSCLKRRFGDLALSPSSGEKPTDSQFPGDRNYIYQLGPTQ